jgi:autotransporter translocation and assembly factor TamB
MRTSDFGSGTRAAALGIALLGGTVAALAQATFDFTGHWTGTGTQTGKSPATLTADLMTGSSPKLFTGTLTIQGANQCNVKGKLKRHDKIMAHLTGCTDGSHVLLTGKLDTTTQTIMGHFVSVKKGKIRRGTFTLTKAAASPSGAFLDDPERAAP